VTDLRGPTRMCELMAGWSLKPGDCNDFNPKVNPDGVEVCNSQDDNCNGKFNEGFENTIVYKDADGDGYGDRFSTEMRMGCGDGFGWSSVRTDCDDADRTIHPGAVEICNNKDDNCSGRVDEGARRRCWVLHVAERDVRFAGDGHSEPSSIFGVQRRMKTSATGVITTRKTSSP